MILNLERSIYMQEVVPTSWPKKQNLFGVEVSVTSYQEVVRTVMYTAMRRERAVVTFMPAHGIVAGVTDPAFRKCLADADIVAPDGQPVRWALNYLHKSGLEDRVYGPETMKRICLRAAQNGISIYLCGSSADVVRNLETRLVDWFPTLKIAGRESPPFRPMTAQENDAICERINASGAAIVFIGMGCPRQEIFAHANRNKINAVQMCVGAAFDFHAGNKKMAPAFFQKRGLEWLYRLTQEPSRLWKRYLVTNTIFLSLLALAVIKMWARLLWGEDPVVTTPEGPGA
jgi:exopolysaccharide biosynthesis WecB/TagA/CpsF family protein